MQAEAGLGALPRAPAWWDLVVASASLCRVEGLLGEGQVWSRCLVCAPALGRRCEQPGWAGPGQVCGQWAALGLWKACFRLWGLQCGQEPPDLGCESHLLCQPI